MTSLKELEARSRDAVEHVTPETLLPVRQKLDYRFDVCKATGGVHRYLSYITVTELENHPLIMCC